MSLTTAQKADIRKYLGYSSRFYQTDTVLEQGMLAIDNDPDAITLLLAEITSCKAIDTKLSAAQDRLKASTVAEIELNKNEIAMLRAEGRRYASRVSAILGAPIRHDAFSSNRYVYNATYTGLKRFGTGGGNFGQFG